MLVGDIIMRLRYLMQDPPQSLATPTISGATVIGSSGSTLPAATYYIQITQWTSWGESLPSIEFPTPLTTLANQALQVQSPVLPGAVKMRVYFGTASGGENQFFETTTSNVNGWVAVVSAPGSGGSPPSTNSAYLPDTDGSYLRAFPIFDWLNDGLHQGSRLVGGLIDYSGFPSVLDYATYVVPGEWTRIYNAWYDGYPVAFSQTGAFFKRNQVTSSILAGWAISFYNDTLGVELWPQPARTAAQTTVAAPMGVADNAVTLASTGGFLLPTYGMVQIGTEICAYNGVTATQLTGLIRGLGGTIPTAWANGTQVNELNAFFQGRRVFTNRYTPGQSLVSIPIPTAFGGVLVNFLLSKFLESERDWQGAEAKIKQFETACKDFLRQNRQIAGPQQVGSRDYQFVVFGGTRFGGTVLP